MFYFHFVPLSNGSTKRLSNESHDISRDLCCLDMRWHCIRSKDLNEKINMFSNIRGLTFTSGGVNLDPTVEKGCKKRHVFCIRRTGSAKWALNTTSKPNPPEFKVVVLGPFQAQQTWHVVVKPTCSFISCFLSQHIKTKEHHWIKTCMYSIAKYHHQQQQKSFQIVKLTAVAIELCRTTSTRKQTSNLNSAFIKQQFVEPTKHEFDKETHWSAAF